MAKQKRKENQQRTVAVLTNDTQLQDNISKILRKKQYNLCFFENVPKFSQTVKKSSNLVCIIDVTYNGRMEILPIIRQAIPKVPLIVIAEKHSEETVNKIHESHIHYYFEKPFDFEELLIAVSSAFELFQQHFYIEEPKNKNIL